jgi:hypothetical protein
VSSNRVVLVQTKRKSRLLISLGLNDLVGDREGGGDPPPLKVKTLPVEFQSELHGPWVGLNIGDPPKLATC